MRVSVFLALASLPSVLSQESINVTTSLITITPAPSTTPIAVSQAFIGYSTEPALGAYTIWFCPPGQIWSQDGNYARCCDSDQYVECGIATACYNTSLMVGPSSQQTWTCSGTGTQTLCVTGTVYPSIGATQGVTNVQCWPSWNGGNWNATRDIAITSPSLPVTTMLAIPTTTVLLTTSTSQQANTPTPSGSALPLSRGLHTSAIIGIVVGVVILAVTVAIAIYLFLYKRMQHIDPSRETETVATDHVLQCDSNWLKPELSAQSRETELPVEHNTQFQMSQIKVQERNKAARPSEDSISSRITGSTESGGVPVFDGRAGRSSA